MSDLPWFWIAMGAIVLGTVLFNRWLDRRSGRAAPVCQHCGSEKMEEIKRDSLGSRPVELYGGGSPAGADIRLQIDYEVTYRCGKCEKETAVRITETQ